MKNQLTIAFLFLSLLVSGQTDAIFHKATEAYNKGNYEKAITNYLDILEKGQHSAALYFNLGNSYYKLNQIAPSIYYYEKALLITPNDAEIKNNLAYAQNMTLDAIAVMPETGFSKIYNDVISFFSFDQWAVIAILFMMLFVVLYIAFYFLIYATHKRIAFVASIASLLIAIAALLFAYAEHNAFNADQPAIVFASEINIKAEPNKRSQNIYQLHEGTKLHVLEELNGWKKIKISDGQTGWVNGEDIKMLKDF